MQINHTILFPNNYSKTNTTLDWRLNLYSGKTVILIIGLIQRQEGK